MPSSVPALLSGSESLPLVVRLARMCSLLDRMRAPVSADDDDDDDDDAEEEDEEGEEEEEDETDDKDRLAKPEVALPTDVAALLAHGERNVSCCCERSRWKGLPNMSGCGLCSFVRSSSVTEKASVTLLLFSLLPLPLLLLLVWYWCCP